MLEKKDVTGMDSFNYIRGRIKGAGALFDCVFQFPIESGRVSAFVPEGTSDKKLYSFESGGLYHFDTELLKGKYPVVEIQNDSKEIVLSEIQQHIGANEENCCLFEDPVRSPASPRIIRSGIEYVHLNNEKIFYFFDKSNSDSKKIDIAYSTSEEYVFLCVLSTVELDKHYKFSPFKEITISLLELFVKKMSAFIVEAYDHEGYLLWRRE